VQQGSAGFVMRQTQSLKLSYTYGKAIRYQAVEASEERLGLGLDARYGAMLGTSKIGYTQHTPSSCRSPSRCRVLKWDEVVRSGVGKSVALQEGRVGTATTN
jgi:hypothetical protein